MLLLQFLLGLLGVQTPQVSGVQNLGRQVANGQVANLSYKVNVDWLLGLAFDDHEIEASEFEVGTKVAPSQSAGHASREGAFSHGYPFGESLSRRAPQRPGQEKQLVLRSQGLDARGQLIVEVLDPKAPPPHKVSLDLFGDRLGSDRSSCQV
jgi:hypothetical protein